MSNNEAIVKKIGLTLKGTPTLVVLYNKSSLAERAGKFRRRSMPIRGLYRNSNLKVDLNKRLESPINFQLITAELVKKHSILEKIDPLRIEKLLSIVQENLKGAPVAEAIASATKKYSLNPDEDFNVLDDDALQVKKELMASSFEKHAIKPNDPSFKYDVQVDFNSFETSAGWDSDSDGVVDF